MGDALVGLVVMLGFLARPQLIDDGTLATEAGLRGRKIGLADRKRGEFSSWYELFPRSSAEQPGVEHQPKDWPARL